MKWHYRTILFEFQKDGLLGDRYIDDDEMENVLNEHGQEGWELVNVSPVQEGLLAFLKKPHAQPGVRGGAEGERPIARATHNKQTPSGAQPQTAVKQGSSAPAPESGSDPDKIGGIKIS